jgi:hypothetical protein
VSSLFRGTALSVFVGALIVGSLVLLWPGIFEFATTARITLHWSRLLVGTFGLFMAAQAMVTWVMVQIVNLWSYQKVEEARLAADVATIAPREAVVPGAAGVTG